MKVLIPVEARFLQTPDGAHWVRSPSTYEFWARYLTAFDEVLVLARVARVSSVSGEFNRADGPSVRFVSLPHFIGPVGYLKNWREYDRVARAALLDTDAVILRLPGQTSGKIFRLLPKNRAFGVEIVGDPWEVFAPGASTHPLRPLLRRFFTSSLKRAIARASCVAYVTTGQLQLRYPAKSASLVTSYSSVQLGTSAFAVSAKTPPVAGGPLKLVTVGSLDQPYKGVDTLVRAASACQLAGWPVRLSIVGDGRLRVHLQRLVAELGLDASVTFHGQLPSGAAVREVLDDADVFVLASRTEGLPRAMLEAMARGMPCLGTRVGGIPELLEDEFLFEPGEWRELGGLLTALATDRKKFAGAADRNLVLAHSYASAVLAERRNKMYGELHRLALRLTPEPIHQE